MATETKVEVIRLPKRSGSDCYGLHEIVWLDGRRAGYLEIDATGHLFEGHDAAVYGVLEGMDYGGNVRHTRKAPRSTRGICAPLRGIPILGAYGREDSLIAYVDFE